MVEVDGKAYSLGHPRAKAFKKMMLTTPIIKSGEVMEPAVEKESDLHNDILDECRKRGWIALHGSMAHLTHRNEGEPDFIVLAENPDVYLIEAKSKTGKLSPAQQAFAAHAKKLGWTVEVVRSMEAFLDTITKTKTEKATP